MKKGLFVLLLFLGLPFVNYAQYENDFSPFQSQDKGDAINEERERRMNEYLYQLQMEQQKREAELERKVREAAAKAQQRNASSSNARTSNSSRSSTMAQKKRDKKARREAEHQAWLESRAEASRRAAEKRYRAEQRERAERQQRYNKAFANEMQRTEKKYANYHNQVDYAASEGFDNMMNTHPAGTERMQSGYVPSSVPKNPEIAYIVPKTSSRSVVRIVLTGHEHSSLNSLDWNNWMISSQEMERIESMPPLFDNKTEKYLNELEEKLDGGQIRMLKYYLKSNNKQEVTEETDDGTIIKEKGVMPEALGINDKGRYIFESSDGMRVFAVSSNGRHLLMATLDTHSWNDENIIKKIQEGGFEQYLKESFGIKGVFKNGEFTWDEWKGKPIEEIATKLPKIKAEIKMSLFDNSSNLAVQYYYLAPQSVDYMSPQGENKVWGAKLELSGGGKAEVSTGFNLSDVAKYSVDYQYEKQHEKSLGKDSDDDGKTGKDFKYGSAKAGVETAKVSATVTAGRVYSRGGKYILCTGEATVSASLMIDIKTLIKPANVIRPGKSYGVSCKDITNP